ncbi:MAG TPA: ankyrin repeat domain-containing protein [Pyrinomonadaceae bacterium]|nr:ankyrin repeat domain-containing protein [Pyrinomonadaceae bacterium]
MNRAKTIALVIFSCVIVTQLILSARKWIASSGDPTEYQLPADKPLEQKRDLTAAEEAFMRSAEKGDSAAVGKSLAEGINPNAKDQTGKTALMWAVTSGDLVTVKLLLDHGADLSARDDQGHTAFTLAAAKRRMDIAQVLLNKGAKPDTKDKGNSAVKKK